MVGIPGVGWAKLEVHQLIRKAVLEQGAHLVDMRAKSDVDCTYWSGGENTNQVPERCHKFGRRVGYPSNTIIVRRRSK